MSRNRMLDSQRVEKSMYEVPKNLNWPFLFGRELLQVCYGKHETQLRFDGDICISIEAGVVHSHADQVLGKSIGREQGISSLIGLLGASIEQVHVEAQDTLTLQFSNAHVLRVLKDEEPYECFSISAPGQQTIVV
jgi:hypothetical protein